MISEATVPRLSGAEYLRVQSPISPNLMTGVSRHPERNNWDKVHFIRGMSVYLVLVKKVFVFLGNELFCDRIASA